MRCLRCAGAPRRPARGSALYLLDPSQHVDLYVPGEPVAAYIQFLRDTHLPSPGTIWLGTPDVKQCRGLLVHHCYDLLSCSPPLRRLLLPLSTVRSPSPLADITTVATGRFHRRVFHPLDLQLASLHRFLTLYGAFLVKSKFHRTLLFSIHLSSPPVSARRFRPFLAWRPPCLAALSGQSPQPAGARL